MLLLSLTGIQTSYNVYQYPDLSFFCRPGRSAPSTSVLMKRGVWAQARWSTFSRRIFSYSLIFHSHFHLSRVQVEEYKKKYGPNGEFINNIWCQCWWSDESHTCLPHLFSQTWWHWKGKQGDIFRLRDNFRLGSQFHTAGKTFSDWQKVRQHATWHWGGRRNTSRRRASRYCWVNEKGWTWREAFNANPSPVGRREVKQYT